MFVGPKVLAIGTMRRTLPFLWATGLTKSKPWPLGPEIHPALVGPSNRHRGLISEPSMNDVISNLTFVPRDIFPGLRRRNIGWGQMPIRLRSRSDAAGTGDAPPLPYPTLVGEPDQVPHQQQGEGPRSKGVLVPTVPGGRAKVVDYAGEVRTTTSTGSSRPRIATRSGRPPGYSASISE